MQQAVEVGPNTAQYLLRSNHFECPPEYQNRENLVGWYNGKTPHFDSGWIWVGGFIWLAPSSIFRLGVPRQWLRTIAVIAIKSTPTHYSQPPSHFKWHYTIVHFKWNLLWKLIIVYL
jgi:hypothetical protein